MDITVKISLCVLVLGLVLAMGFCANISNDPEWYSDDITDKDVFIQTDNLSVNTHDYDSSKIDNGYLKLKKSSGVELWIKLDEITNIQWGY